MIDKSIRQHYQDGENVDQLKKWTTELTGNVKEKYLPEGKLDIGQVAKTALTNKLTSAATKKLAGTGILSSLGPIGMLIAYMLAKKGINYAKGKMPKDIGQAFTQGFTGLGVGSPQEQKELRVLEKRRADMLQRKADPNKDYSEKNLDMVTRAIAEAKGLDINNPNEMRNIDKPIQQIQIEKRITEPSRVIPKTPEVIIPHLEGGDEKITTPKISPISYEDDFATTTIKDIIPTPTTVTRDVGLGDAGIAERIAAENRAAAQAAAQAAASKAAAARAVDRHTGGGGDAGTAGGSDAGHAAAGGSGMHGGRHYLKGGRVDKALSGRSRDI